MQEITRQDPQVAPPTESDPAVVTPTNNGERHYLYFHTIVFEANEWPATEVQQ